MVILKDLLHTLPRDLNICLVQFGSPNKFICIAPVGSDLINPFKHMEVRYTFLPDEKTNPKCVGFIHTDADLMLYIREPLMIENKEE